MTNRLTEIDRDALSRALEVAGRDPSERAQIDRKLAQGADWADVAMSAAFGLQCQNLELRPWESPPMYGDVVRPRLDQHAAALLRKLQSLGLSRFELHPTRAIAEAEAKRKRHASVK